MGNGRGKRKSGGLEAEERCKQGRSRPRGAGTTPFVGETKSSDNGPRRFRNSLTAKDQERKGGKGLMRSEKRPQSESRVRVPFAQ